ncbi:hypothetical protein N2603_28940 [Bradyrhizobium huanghuaihaiense]|uniref:hypothetical protein n=1 Tax=Bradyrhizobium huanghuaihaiense TaxID=990078 RepID=UPI0021A98906|nr:hypothetical protein [Bradyrhizobium sp. CB3035]UWU74075.1 hypothetical protein N2603_28940 [Bradyrhizobium sp. CB3035]
MNDSPHTSWPAFINDVQADYPEHFDWGALAALRTKSVPAAVTGAAEAASGRNSVFGDGRAAQTVPPSVGLDFRPGIEPTSLPDEPATASAGAIDPTSEARATQGDAAPLSGALPPERSAVDQEPLPLATIRRSQLPLPEDGILRLRFSDVGEPSEPGEHRSHYGLVEVTRSDLAVWKAFPDAVFTVIQPSPYSNATIFRLGTFEV